MKRGLLSGISLGLLLASSPAVHGNAAVPPGRPIGSGIGPGGGAGGPGAPPIGLGGPVGGPGFGGPAAPAKVKFAVEVDEKAKEARLVVPMNLMMQGFGIPGGGPGGPGGGFGAIGAPPGGLPPGIQNPPGSRIPPGVFPGGTAPPGAPPGGQPTPPPSKLPGGVGRLSLPTVVIGLALTMAFASGGVWLVRRGNRQILAGLLVVGTFAVGATALLADIGVGPRPRPQPQPFPQAAKGTPVPMPATVRLADRIQLQLTGPGDTIRLIVPKDAVAEKVEDKEEKKPEPKKPRKEDD